MDNISRISSLSAEKRYDNFVATIIETQTVWFLEYEDAFTMFKNDDGGVDLLVWQDKKLAEQYAVEGEKPVSMTFDDFIEQCNGYLGSSEVMLMVCPVGDEDVLIVNMEQMLTDIDNKMP